MQIKNLAHTPHGDEMAASLPKHIENVRKNSKTAKNGLNFLLEEGNDVKSIASCSP